MAAAGEESLPALQQRCRAVRAEGAAARERYQRVHDGRYLRHWTDGEGALCLQARLCPDDGAKVLAAIEAYRPRIFATARGDGRREPYQAYTADALVALAESDGSGRTKKGPGAMVHVRVDHAALVRGHTEDDETCDIPGVGPIPVASARALGADCILKVLVTRGCRRHRGRPCRTNHPGPCAQRPRGPRSRLRDPRLRRAQGPGDRPPRSLRRGRSQHPRQPGAGMPLPPRPQDPPRLGPGRPARGVDLGPSQKTPRREKRPRARLRPRSATARLARPPPPPTPAWATGRHREARLVLSKRGLSVSCPRRETSLGAHAILTGFEE